MATIRGRRSAPLPQLRQHSDPRESVSCGFAFSWQHTRIPSGIQDNPLRPAARKTPSTTSRAVSPSSTSSSYPCSEIRTSPFSTRVLITARVPLKRSSDGVLPSADNARCRVSLVPFRRCAKFRRQTEFSQSAKHRTTVGSFTRSPPAKQLEPVVEVVGEDQVVVSVAPDAAEVVEAGAAGRAGTGLADLAAAGQRAQRSGRGQAADQVVAGFGEEQRARPGPTSSPRGVSMRARLGSVPSSACPAVPSPITVSMIPFGAMRRMT